MIMDDAFNMSAQQLQDEDDISLINPFATTPRRVRHRVGESTTASRPATFMTVDDISCFGEEASSFSTQSSRQPLHHHQSSTPGTAGFLEIEEEPSSSSFIPGQDVDLLGLAATQETIRHEQQQVRTSSGLFLTHRQATNNTTPSNMSRSRPAFEPRNNNNNHENSSHETLEVEAGYSFYGSGASYTNGYSKPPQQQQTLLKAKRLLSYVKCWNAAFLVFLLIGTGVIIHSIRHERAAATEMKSQADASIAYNLDSTNEQQEGAMNSAAKTSDITEQIILRPLPNATLHRKLTVARPEQQPPATLKDHGIRQSLAELRQEFQEWVATHKKVYATKEEEERRFQIWHANHHKTIEKNKRHGPCKMTGKPVFGSTYFKDLTTEEFTSQYLTGYKGPHTDQLLHPQRHDSGIGSPKHDRKLANAFVPGSKERAQARHASSNTWHPSVRERYLGTWEAPANPYQSSSGCSFYDVSCWLQWFVYTYGSGIGGTMEPKYDDDSYPEGTQCICVLKVSKALRCTHHRLSLLTAIDWRDYGCVSSVHSQGNCGACWAITAVETIESAYALKTGTLIDLSETEVIVCEDSCEMCNGGWPQNAYDFNMENGGLLAESDWSYDGDFLYSLTAAQDGESENYE